MRRVRSIVCSLLALAVLLASLGYAGRARAGEQYAVTLEAKGEAALFYITAPQQNSGVRLSTYVFKGQTKTESLAADGVQYYIFRITACDKTSDLRWNRGGKGVTVTIQGCDAYSFTQER